MALKAVVNGKIVTPTKVIDDGVIVIKDDRIMDYGFSADVSLPQHVEIIDANGEYVAPGFIDIHCHACGGYWVYENPQAVVNELVKHGVTGFLPTIPYTISVDDTVEGIKKILKCKSTRFGSVIIGINMEGPYINKKYGMASWTARIPNPDEYNHYLKLAGDYIKIWTFAPEIENINEFIDDISQKGIIMAVGHSEAEGEKVLELVPKGLKLACHCMNATGVTPSPPRYEGTREFGIDEAVILSDNIYVEVIPDSKGVHVRPLMLKLICKAKGVDKVIIISDATEFSHIKNNQNKSTEDIEDLYFNEYGQLAGSRLTMDCAVMNMIKHTGISIVDAFKMSSLNPATLLDIQDNYGSLEKGKKANIIIVDNKINVKKVMLNGELVV